MKRVLYLLFIILTLICYINPVMADDSGPGDPPEEPQPGDDPIGGGAPVGSGSAILFGLALVYSGAKFYKVNKENAKV